MRSDSSSSVVDVRTAAAGVLACALVLVLAASEGGYFPVTWGWSTLGLLVTLGTAALLVERVELGRLDAALVIGLAALSLWVAFSVVWSDSPPRSVMEAMRMVLYLVAAVTLALLALRDSVSWVIAGVWAAATAICVYSLAAYVVDDSRPDRLSGPIGYWNALALLAALGAVLAVGLVLDGRGIVRIAAAASFAVLIPTLFLTESRGTWLALVAGMGVALLFEPRTWRLPARLRRLALAAGAVVAVLAVATAVLLAAGRATDAFRGTSPSAEAALRDRLLSVSGSGRDEYWRVASEEYRHNLALGSGAGTYELYWNRLRRTIYGARDAHSLYLETLAELGPVGLVLLLAALGVPLLGAYRARGRPLVAAAVGAYTTYLVHAALDWDWEMPAVTLAALACGVALITSARELPVRRSLVRSDRLALVVPAVALAAVVAFWHAGNGALAESERAMGRSDFLAARLAAERAGRLAPWASAPRGALAAADLALGDTPDARESAEAGLDRDPLDWRLWFLLSAASNGSARERALARSAQLNPLSAEVRAFQDDLRKAKARAQAQ